MALKKPGDFFQRKEVVKLKEEIDQLVNPELSELSGAYGKYKDNVNKFQSLSDSIENLQKEVKDIKVEVYKKEELNEIDLESIINSSLLLEQKIKEIKENVEKESKNVLNISSIKHRKLEEDIKIYHDKALSVIQNEVGKIEKDQKSYNSKLSSIRSEIFRTEDLKKVTEKVKEDLAEFQKVDYDISEKIKHMEDVFVKFNEQVTLKENVITEPPSTDNNDPLTPLDQKFVTFDQLSDHYRVFINRIQQQLSTLGGGGAVRIQDMDDIDLSTAKVNNKFLKYNSTSGKWEGADASGGAGTVNIIDDTTPQLGGNLDLNSNNITGTGNINITGTVTATDINSASDIKLKKNIKTIENPISKIMGIEGVSFNWKYNNKPSLGVTADHLQNILPELVKEDDIKSVNYNGLVGLLIECVKNQQQQIDELKDKLNN